MTDHATADVLIRNEKGLHARASAKFVKCAETFQSEITVTKDGHGVGAGGVEVDVGYGCLECRWLQTTVS